MKEKMNSDDIMGYYLILYRNDLNQRGFYVGRTIHFRRREVEHMATVFNDWKDKKRALPHHYQIAKRIVLSFWGEMRFIPITYVDRRQSSARTLVSFTEQLLILLFEAYHAGLHSEWIRTQGTDDAAQNLSHGWSAALTEVLSHVTQATKNNDRFQAFRLPQPIEGCNWGSPLLENHWMNDSKLWTRTTVYNTASGLPEKYQFRGPVRIARMLKNTADSLIIRIIVTDPGLKHRPTSFRVSPMVKTCPGLRDGMEVNVVAEIMVPHKGRYPPHPTPYLPVPEVGPFDMYNDVAAMSIRIEWQKDDGQWMARPLVAKRMRPALMSETITTAKDGPEAEYMTTAWLRSVKLMGALMQWQWQSNKPFVRLMVKYPGRVRCVETDFLNQQYVVSPADIIKRPAPKLLDREQTAGMLLELYGHDNMMVGFPPKKGWWANPGKDMRVALMRTRCDVCVFVSAGVVFP